MRAASEASTIDGCAGSSVSLCSLRWPPSQVQTIAIATVGLLVYLAHGAISWPLVLAVGIPELLGVLLGWKLARTVPTRG